MFSIGSGRQGVEFRLEQIPMTRPQYAEWTEKLVNAVRDARDGNAKRFAKANAAEDLFLDLYIPQIKAWQDALHTDGEWGCEDSRYRMKQTLETAIAGMLGIHSADVFTSALSFIKAAKDA